MYKIYFLLLSSFLFSCGMRLNYLGTSSSPTENVDVFVDANAIKKSYTVIGKGYPEGLSLSKKSYEIMQKKAIRKAKEKGADAILFQDHYFIDNNVEMRRTDSTNYVSTGIGHVVNTRTDILFLKYN